MSGDTVPKERKPKQLLTHFQVSAISNMILATHQPVLPEPWHSEIMYNQTNEGFNLAVKRAM